MTSFVISVREEGGAENLSGKPDILGAQSHIVGQLRHSPTQRPRVTRVHRRGPSGEMAGALSTEPSGANCEPWQGQSQQR